MIMIAKLPLKKIFSGNMRWLDKQQGTILSAASIISAATIISAISGLLIKRILLGRFSDTVVDIQSLEAFWIAFQVPDMMFQLLILGALSAAFIPIFTSLRNKDEQLAFKMSSVLMNLLLAIFTGISIIVFIFAKEITILRTGAEFTQDQIILVTNLTRLMLFSQFFFAISNFLTGILQSYHRFVMPALAAIFYNFGILIGVYLFADSFGIYGAGLGVIIGAFLHMAIQMPLVYKLGFRYSLSFNLAFKGISEFFKLAPPRVLAIGASELKKILLAFFTTSLGNLSFLVIYLAINLMTIPIRFFGTPISQAALPFLSEESENNKAHFRSLLVQSLNQISFLALPASVLLLILRIPAVRLVYGVTNFPWSATLLTGKLVAIVALSIAAQALVQMFLRAYYAMKDTKTPFYVTAIDFVLYALLSAYFVFYTSLGVIGIAIAITITAYVECLIFLGLLNKKIPGILGVSLWLPQLKIGIASFLMAVFLYLPFKIFDELVFDTTKTIELIGLTISTSTIGMIVYLYFAALLDIKELILFKKIFSSFSQSIKNLAKTPEVIVESSGEDSGI